MPNLSKKCKIGFSSKKFALLLLGLFFQLALIVFAQTAHANVPQDCNENGLIAGISAATSADPWVYFKPNCGPITLSKEFFINKTVYISGNYDGQSYGNKVVLKAAPGKRIFNVDNNGILLLLGIKLQGGKEQLGGAILNAGSLLTYYTVFGNNSAVQGGAVYNTRLAYIFYSTFFHNIAKSDPLISDTAGGIMKGFGGAIYNNFKGSSYVTNSTLYANAASDGGGGIYNNQGNLNLLDSTLAENKSFEGGAVYNNKKLRAVIRSSTFVNNEVINGGSGGSLFNTQNGSILVDNTILFNRLNPNCSGNINEIKGANNIEFEKKNANCSQLNSAIVDPMLNTLSNYGGPTLTYQLLQGSPAIDKGSDLGCKDSTTNKALDFDQRGQGFPRKNGAACDIGAYETNMDSPTCGNGKPDPGEDCDHGANNGQPGDTCDASCHNTCGNGKPDPGEQCDHGASNGTASDSCDQNCQNKCGNGMHDAGEDCDHGANNGKPGDTCDASCHNIIPANPCGNGKPDPGEDCDHGANNGTPGDTCDASCHNIIPANPCGNGKPDPGEECDTGNGAADNCGAGFKCSAPGNSHECTCQFTCGDGILDAGEDCDHGNLNGLDGKCSSTCKTINEIIGPDKNPDTGTGNNPLCGNGQVDPGEDCDSKLKYPETGCDDNCKFSNLNTSTPPALTLEGSGACSMNPLLSSSDSQTSALLSGFSSLILSFAFLRFRKKKLKI